MIAKLGKPAFDNIINGLVLGSSPNGDNNLRIKKNNGFLHASR